MSRQLLVSGEEFRWGYSREVYFNYNDSKPGLQLMASLLGIFLVPILFQSIVKYLKMNDHINPKFYSGWMAMVRLLDHRILYTNFSVLDSIGVFLWIILNVVFVDPFNFPSQIGYLVTCNIALIMLPIFRNSIFSVVLKIPFERTVKYHRWLGRGILLLMTIHLAGYWDQWLKAGQFWSKVMILPNMFAHLSWVVLILLTVSSASKVRRNWFEVFFYGHHLYILFFVFGIFHFPPLLAYSLPSFAVFFLDRILRMMRSRPINEDVSIHSDGTITRLSGRRLGMLNYEPGQYCFINIPEISRLQWHPISFSSSPCDTNWQFYIKSMGGWSKSLKSLHGKQPRVKLDGPYGMLTYNVDDYDVVMLCAGGIGVTPMISLIRDIHYKISTHRLEHKKIYLFWTMRDPSMYYALGDCLNQILNCTFSNCFNISVWITQPGNNSPLFIRGRPDWIEIFKTVRETHADVDRVAVLSCGPANLVNSTWDCCNQLSDSSTAFDFHQETFEF